MRISEMGRSSADAPDRRGFTLVELLVTVVVLGILAAIAIRAGNPKDAAYRAQMVSDLRNLMTAQEAYYADHFEYGNNVKALEFQATSGVIDITVGKPHGWTVRVKHKLRPGNCAVFFGTVKPAFKPAVEEGVIACTL